MVELIAPRAGRVLTGIVQPAAALSGVPDGSITFQYSTDAVSWTAIDAVAFPSAKQEWAARWDTSTAPLGSVYVRALVRSTSRVEVVSPSVLVRVTRPPVAVVTANPQSDATIEFDGTESSHPDPSGRIEHWVWDFGDGTSEVGPIVSHTYGSVETPYSGSLTVIDADGNRSAYYFALNFLMTPAFKPEDKCVCESIKVRGQTPPEKALGPKGDGSEGWAAVEDMMDGKALGPLAKNPDNKDDYVGYAFELAAEVTGDPGKCKEIQLVKRTVVFTGLDKEDCTDFGDSWDAASKLCTSASVWTGKTKDLDLDGTDDIDVSTKAKCTAAGGSFDEAEKVCSLAFPHSGAKFGPDEPVAGEMGGAYEAPFDYKVHVAKQVLWLDAPYFRGAAGTKGEWSFVSLLRGTDKKYCYVAFTTTADNTAAALTEKIKQTGTGVGKDSVPGVP